MVPTKTRKVDGKVTKTEVWDPSANDGKGGWKTVTTAGKSLGNDFSGPITKQDIERDMAKRKVLKPKPKPRQFDDEPAKPFLPSPPRNGGGDNPVSDYPPFIAWYNNPHEKEEDLLERGISLIKTDSGMMMFMQGSSQGDAAYEYYKREDGFVDYGVDIWPE